MKRPTIFRTVVLLAGVCTAMWQAPRIIEMIDKVRGGMSPAAAVAGLTGRGQAPSPDEISLDQLRNALSGASPLGGGTPAKPNSQGVVFSPNSAALTEAQRLALLRQADRMRPEGSGVAPKRISTPPGTPRTSRPATIIKDEPVEDADKQGDSKTDHAQPEPKRTGGDKTEKDAAPDGTDESALLSEATFSDEPIGIHDELRELLDQIAPPTRDAATRLRNASRIAWRNPSLPLGSRPAFIIGPPGSGSDRIAP